MIIFIVLTLFSGVLPQPISAQELPITATSAAVISQTSTADGSSLQTAYQTRLEEYVNQYRQTQLDKQQFLQLKTLASLETAVRSTQLLYQLRNEVLVSFLQLQQIKLTQTNLPPAITQTLDTQISTQLITLRSQLETLEQPLDKVQLDIFTQNFVATAESIQDLLPKIEYALQLDQLNRATGTVQQLLLSADELATASSISETAQQRLERSSNVIARQLSQLTITLKSLEADLAEGLTRQISQLRTNNLLETYSVINQTLQLTNEYVTEVDQLAQ